MSILAWIILGLIAGAIARILIPGRQPGGLVTTVLLGVIGAVVGGYVGRAMTGASITGINTTSIVLAVIGAIIVLALWSAVFGKH